MKFANVEIPDGATRIYLIRHGQSIGNLKGLYLGHTDLDLSPEGYEQARRCADYLKDESIDAFYSSDLIRAYNTALPHAKMRGMSVNAERELREIFLGEWEGADLALLKSEQGELFFGGWTDNFGTFTPPGGESVQHLADRIYNEIERIARQNPSKGVLIAIHAAAIRSFWGRVMKIAPEKLASALQFPRNASVSNLYYLDGEFYPIKYSDDSFM